ncbi:MAG TPA: BON domain-containing protein [Chloroflexota bacterium]|nr:BON domain-containing protein [Chloroflexota bacterium]
MGDPGATNRDTRKRQAAAARNSPKAKSSAVNPRDLAEQIVVALAPVQVYGLSALADARGVVTLVGAVRTERDFERAAAAAVGVPGVTRVLNHLVVDTLTGSMPIERTVTDPATSAEIELNHLYFAPGLQTDFDEDVGTTDTAEAAADNVPYFPPTDPPVVRAPRADEGYQVAGGFAETALDAPIELEQLPRRLLTGDDEIARLVRMALREDAGTTDLPIHVRVRHGVVFLRGVVQSLAEVELAEGVASRVPGVEEVQDELEVVGI